MKTILKALRDENKVTKKDATTIARALGGTTIAGAVSTKTTAAGGSSTPKS